MDSQALLKVFPYASKSTVGVNNLAVALTDIFNKLGNQKNRCAGFLAQVGHESQQFTVFTENLNYSAQGLMATFPKVFLTLDDANNYAHQPEKIANRIYANKNGNGNEASGDGFKYRGRGAIQLTGYNNYTACGQFLSANFVEHPELLTALPMALESAYWFWTKRHLNTSADADDIKTMTKLINGGTNGLDERAAKYELAKSVLSTH
jgi:putative chitinase